MGPCVLRSQKDNPCGHNAGFALRRESPALPARSCSVSRAYGCCAALPQRSPFIPFPLDGAEDFCTPGDWERRRRPRQLPGKPASQLPSPSSLCSPCFRPCSVRPCFCHRWPLHPVRLVVLSPSRCWPGRVREREALSLSSTHLLTCHRSAIISHSLHREDKHGGGELDVITLLPFVFKIFVFYFLRCHMHAIKCVDLKC